MVVQRLAGEAQQLAVARGEGEGRTNIPHLTAGEPHHVVDDGIYVSLDRLPYEGLHRGVRLVSGTPQDGLP